MLQAIPMIFGRRAWARSLALTALLARVLAAPALAQDTITIHGSDTMLVLNHQLAAEYSKTVRAVEISVLGGGSEIGLAALMAGRTDIAAASRPMKEEELAAFAERTGARPQEIVVALDGLAIYVHDWNPLSTLSLSQLGDIMTGKVRNWSEVGGVNMPIEVYNRDLGSGTRTFMEEHVMGGKPFVPGAQVVSTTARVAASVSSDPAGIGYGGIAYAKNGHILKLSLQPGEMGIYPSRENVISGAYPLSRSLYYYVNPASMSDDLRRFLDWVQGPDGQMVVRKVGFYEAPRAATLPSVLASPPPAAPPAAPRGTVALTPASMRQLGFDLVLAFADGAADLRPGQTQVTLRFSTEGAAIQRIQSCSMRVGEDIDVPLVLAPDFSLKFALRKTLLEQATVCLAEAGAPDEGAVYEVALRDFALAR